MTQVETMTPEGALTPGHRVVQRVVLPAGSDADALPLYLDAGAVASRREDPAAEGASAGSAPVELASTDVLRGRQSVAVKAGHRLSFATYFNAFPASYWRRWTDVEQVRLTVEVQGRATVIVYRSNAKGAQQRVTSFSTESEPVISVDLPLKPFGDGGWYWFDIVGHGKTAVMERAEWSVPDNGKRGTVTLGTTTMNRPDYCLATIRTVAGSPEVREILDTMLIIDQGTQKVTAEPGFEEVAAEMGDQLTVIDQGNIGGSGGFSRAMYETVMRGDSGYVLLLDDDIILEPESITRLVAFGDYARTPTIVGGHMFDMYNRTVLHTFGEIVNPWRIQPDVPHEDNYLGHDFAASNLRATNWLHRRTDVDYNGWWMCLIPVEVIKTIGLSLPVFIKWDDAEYGLRAAEHGFPTVTLPGAAVWHVSWGDKDDLVGWQAYFHERNRLITTLLHSLYDRGGRVLRESTYMDVKHIVSMQYYTERLRLLAMRDLLEGPDSLHGIIGTRLPEIRAMAGEFSDAEFKPGLDRFPAPVKVKPPNRGRGFRMPSRAALVPWSLKTIARQLVSPVEEKTQDRPQANLAHQDARWFRLSQYDSVIVTNADGTAASWYKRRPELTREMLAESAALHARMLKEWPELRKAYRDALPRITSIEAWERTFAENTPS